MSDGHAPDGLAEEELAFWREFIAWWARKKDTPVPVRAWEALARAERRCAGFGAGRRTHLSA